MNLCAKQVFRLGFFNLTLSDGRLYVWLSVRLCVCKHYSRVYVSSCSLFYGCKRLLWGTLRPIPKVFSKFSFLAIFWPEFEEFSEIGTFHKVCAHFLLVSFRTDFRIKMGLLGVPLGVCLGGCTEF